MKKLGNSKQETEKPVSAIERKCAAYGCPLPGSITDSLYGPTNEVEWLCRFHSGHERSEWQQITHKLRTTKTEKKEIPKNRYEGLTPEQCKKEIQRIQKSPKPEPLEWAYRLRAKEELGEIQCSYQMQIWREALKGKQNNEDIEG